MDALAKQNRRGANYVHADIVKHAHGNDYQEGEDYANTVEEWAKKVGALAVFQPAMVRVVEHYLAIDLYFE